MEPKTPITPGIYRYFARLGLCFSRADALVPLALLGILCGLVTGLVIIGFRLSIDYGQTQLLSGGQPYHPERLSTHWRLLLPVMGGLFLGAVFQWLSRSHNTQVGIIHVLERLNYHQGYMPFRSMLLQFFGGAVSIFSGHAVGREGPAIHLGAATGSLIGQRLKTPNKNLRLLVGCGSAAAFAASFNTPLAGVLFALEVIILEYKLRSATPIILAAVSASTLSRAVFGPELAFSVPALELKSVAELPYLLLMGLVLGLLATSFIAVMERVTRWSLTHSFVGRFLLAGLITGICALFVPQILGIGYDTVNAALTSSLVDLGLGTIAMILIFKFVATTLGLGLGLPGGPIGPSLFIGSLAGTLAGVFAPTFYAQPSAPGYYALLGMGAMLGACLQAPLTAVIFLVELTANHAILLPGVVVILAASLTSRELFGKKSLFTTLLNVQGLNYNASPAGVSLLSAGVASAMERDIVELPAITSLDAIQISLDKNSRWVIISQNHKPVALMPTADLARYYLETIQSKKPAIHALIHLLEIPARRLQLAPIELQANLRQALEYLDHSGAEALYVERTNPNNDAPYLYGILTRDLIEASYRQVI